jgi:hypothetical protein
MFGCPRMPSAPEVVIIGSPVPMSPVSMRIAVVSPYHERRSHHNHGRRGATTTGAGVTMTGAGILMPTDTGTLAYAGSGRARVARLNNDWCSSASPLHLVSISL